MRVALAQVNPTVGDLSGNARIVIDACRPWNRRDTFPIVARSSKELDDRIRAKWAHVLPRGR